MKWAKARLKASGYTNAIDLGKISPKINSSTVPAATAIPSPESPNIRSAAAVSTTEIAMLTILFPIKIVDKNFCLFCRIFSARAAARLFRSRKKRSLSLFKDKNAVSADEKNIDSKNSANKLTRSNSVCGGSPVSIFDRLY